jgi:hypothetical protein
MIVDEKYLLDQQKEEIEFLAKDRDRYRELFHQAVKNRDEFAACCDTYIKQRQAASVNYQNLENMNKLLKKQVDEFRKDSKIYEAIYDFMKEKGIVSVDEMKTLINFSLKSSMLKEHIVKDTAKDILQELWDETEATENDEWVRAKIKEIAKSKGVEVE